jgi:parallel beta-helix repeat protein
VIKKSWHNGAIIQINANYVNISKFTIKGNENSYGPSNGIDAFTNNSNISNNIIKNFISNTVDRGIGINLNGNYYPPLISKTFNNTISNNLIDSTVTGIRLYRSCYNKIIGNIINNTDTGIYLDRSSNNKINRNIIKGSEIYLWGSSYNNILENIISNSNSGIRIGSSNNCTINKNVLKENEFGLNLEGTEKNRITNNDFLSNKKDVRFIKPITDDLILSVFDFNSNTWKNNYWDRSRVMPKLIIGFIPFYLIPLPLAINVDMSPAKTPNCDF